MPSEALPKGIPRRCFPRKDKLVDRLESRNHELSHAEARCQAELLYPRGYGEYTTHYRSWRERFVELYATSDCVKAHKEAGKLAKSMG